MTDGKQSGPDLAANSDSRAVHQLYLSQDQHLLAACSMNGQVVVIDVRSSLHMRQYLIQ